MSFYRQVRFFKDWPENSNRHILSADKSGICQSPIPPNHHSYSPMNLRLRLTPDPSQGAVHLFLVENNDLRLRADSNRGCFTLSREPL